MISVVEDFKGVSEGGGKGVELDVILSDFLGVLHFQMIELLRSFPLWIDRSEIDLELENELIPVIGPLRIIITKIT